MKLILSLTAVSLVALAGCKSMSYDVITTHAAGGGAMLDVSPDISLKLAYVQSDMAMTPVIGQDGKPISLPDACNAQHPISSYSILSGNATAQANTPNAANASSTASAAVAINRAQAVGYAADALARAEEMKAYGPGYDAERAHTDCSKTAPVLTSPKVPQ